ncbi:hypothetical protein [Glycomyces artemisiae]|uniref:hypothetical protein n=1 Tax=Glycomyces artemisiae TaxID=1076443 RepID=UPI0011B28B49|nr:hypothetical protein [Glycomyces artemisiae]
MAALDGEHRHAPGGAVPGRGGIGAAEAGLDAVEQRPGPPEGEQRSDLAGIGVDQRCQDPGDRLLGGHRVPALVVVDQVHVERQRQGLHRSRDGVHRSADVVLRRRAAPVHRAGEEVLCHRSRQRAGVRRGLVAEAGVLLRELLDAVRPDRSRDPRGIAVEHTCEAAYAMGDGVEQRPTTPELLVEVLGFPHLRSPRTIDFSEAEHSTPAAARAEAKHRGTACRRRPVRSTRR